MNNETKLFILIMIFYALLEFIWIFGMNNFYATQFKNFTKDRQFFIRSNLAVLLVYPILFIGFYYFVINQITIDTPMSKAVILGAFFGLVVYGVYNLTNIATIPGYSWNMALIDLSWGILIFAILAFLFSALQKRFNK